MTATDVIRDGAAELRAARTFRRLMTTAVGLGFLVLVAVSLVTAVLVSRDRKSTHWVNHTYQVARQLADLRVEFERTESSRRGFIITHDPAYASSYHASATRLPQLLEAIGAFTTDNPVQRENVAALRPLLIQKLDEEEGSLRVASSDQGQVIDPATLMRQDQGLIDRIRVLVNAMTEEERRLLAIRTDLQAANAELLLGVVLTSGGLLALIAGGSFLLMRRYAADLDRSQQALRRLNEGLEDAVRNRTADLTRANEEIQRFAYIVSHDLRSPLVNVMGFTSELEVAFKILHKHLDEAEAQAPQLVSPAVREAVERDLPEAIGFIRSSTQKMDRLINAILRLSREGRRVLNVEPVDMDKLVAGILASLKHQADAKGAMLQVEGTLPTLSSDRLAVEQVFSNLVENALKYLNPGRPGQIVVRGREAGAALVYEVQDNGRGIDPRDHERVFELFRRAGAQDQPGEGIGLAHVRALITRLGGSIALESALDQGAIFRVSLPATNLKF